MATIDLGKIKLVWRGTYNNSTAYVVDDLVAFTDNGDCLLTYLATQQATTLLVVAQTLQVGTTHHKVKRQKLMLLFVQR